MRLLRNAVYVSAVVLCAAVVTSVALAAPTGRISPYIHCTDGSETIPAGQELVIRSVWATSAVGQATKFMDEQKITWYVYEPDATPNDLSDNTLLASRVPTTFGDLTYWTGPTAGEGEIDGVQRKLFASSYLAPTGVSLASGQSVILAYRWESRTPVSDGFGYSTGKLVYATASCTITGA